MSHDRHVTDWQKLLSLRYYLSNAVHVLTLTHCCGYTCLLICTTAMARDFPILFDIGDDEEEEERVPIDRPRVFRERMSVLDHYNVFEFQER